MKIRCVKCDKEFDDKYYVANKNRLGFEETILNHVKQHEELQLIHDCFPLYREDE